MKTVQAFALLLLFAFFFSSHSLALDWANKFIVWHGDVYVVDEKVKLSEDRIGKKIGQVKRLANDMTGKYYGDASNLYPKGTTYYEIINVSTSEALAIKSNDMYFIARIGEVYET